MIHPLDQSKIDVSEVRESALPRTKVRGLNKRFLNPALRDIKGTESHSSPYSNTGLSGPFNVITEKKSIAKEEIIQMIPYQDPFLMIDTVTTIDRDRITAIKNIKKDDFWVKSHFVNFPIMPGVLLIEALAQAGTILVRHNILNHQEQDILLHTFKEVNFFRPVFPEDQIRLEVKMLNLSDKTALLRGEVFVNDRLCSDSEFILAIVNRRKFREKYARK